MSKKRFGFNVKFDKYKTSNLLKIICIILAIIIIPLEIFLESVLQTVEDNLIEKIQTSFPDPDLYPFWDVFFKIPIYLFSVNTTCLFMCLFFLSTDSLIAFKSAILTCFGVYIMSFLKLVYKDGRPFWLSSQVNGLLCEFDFAGPAFHLFIVSFFWSYNIVMYCMKYAEKVNKV